MSLLQYKALNILVPFTLNATEIETSLPLTILSRYPDTVASMEIVNEEDESLASFITVSENPDYRQTEIELVISGLAVTSLFGP